MHTDIHTGCRQTIHIHDADISFIPAPHLFPLHTWHEVVQLCEQLPEPWVGGAGTQLQRGQGQHAVARSQEQLAGAAIATGGLRPGGVGCVAVGGRGEDEG